MQILSCDLMVKANVLIYNSKNEEVEAGKKLFATNKPSVNVMLLILVIGKV